MLPDYLIIFHLLQTTDDNREKLQAMELFKDTIKLELPSNATTIDSALYYIRNKQQQKRHLYLDDSDGNNDSQLKTDRQTVL